MEGDVIQSLKVTLADLTYALFTLGNEFDLILQQTEDEAVVNGLQRIVSSLRDSNGEVIRLFHEIQTHETGLQQEWYDDEKQIRQLQLTVDQLRSSIDTLLAGNQQFVNSMLES